ncbi:SusD/RagB family nutrient-binding outer membrane lipoprotein [Spirosoma litoris]
MKTPYKHYILAGLLMISSASCSHFDELNANPDAAVNVTAPMLASKLILNITDETISSGKTFMQPFMLGKTILYTEFAEDMQYNNLGRTSFEVLPVLTNVEKMLNYSVAGATKNSYTALGHFVRAWKFFNLTMRVGDIPYSNALKGESNNVAPTYDTQKQVFQGILSELDEADKLFAQGATFEGDPVYAGDVTKWRKVVNTFELQVLLNLYKKTGDTDLKVTDRFKEIVSSRPIFTSNSDNFQLVYSDKASQRYPFYKLNNQAMIYTMVSSTLTDKLKALDDRRLYYYANPSPVQLAKGKAVNDPTAYVGTDPSMVYADLSKIYATKDYSNVNSRYLELPASEPVYLLSYAQLKFMLAEATVRGWISGTTAATYYADGITAAMKFVMDNTPNDAAYHHNMPITADYISSYVASDKVKLAGTSEQQIEQIITQQFLSTFLQAPYNAFFENRRTGYPAFPVNTASNMNVPGNKLPIRWLYPQSELDYNGTNVKSALTNQYSGNDNTNEQMWILK